MMSSTILLFTTILLQATSPQPFAGTWIAQLQGETFARLELTVSDGNIRGQLAMSGFHVDANGDVDVLIRDAGHTAPIFDAVLRDGVLSFAIKDEDDTTRFEMRLDDGHGTLALLIHAELRAQLSQDGIAVPRPITMTRVAP